MIILTSVCTVIGAWAVSMLIGLIGWATYGLRQRRRAAQLIDAMERHPASAVRFAFRARPCRHLLHSPTVDPIDMEHIELMHVSECHLAKDLTRREAA